MCYAHNEKWKKTIDWRNRTTKSRKNQCSEKSKLTSIWEYWKQRHHQTSGDERKDKKEYLKRTRKQLETKLYCRNLIKGINSWPVLLVRYSGPYLQWTRNELQQMDQRTRRLMTMYKALHPRDDIDRLYVSRKKGGRELASIEDSVDTTTWRLYKKSKKQTDFRKPETAQKHKDQQDNNN